MLFFGFPSWAGLIQGTSAFWTVTHSLYLAQQATIPHMEEDIHSFHMTPNTQTFISEIVLFWAESHPKWAPPRICAG